MGNAARLLIVDDHTMFRQGLKVLLGEATDLTVVGEAADGIEAQERARALRPDIILMDSDMPRCGGLQATAAIREELPDVKVVILAGEGSGPDAVYRAITAGAIGYLSKNNRIEDLVAAIRRVAAGEAVLTPGSLTSLVQLIHEAPAATSKQAPLVGRLSAREQEVLNLLAQGSSNRDIASELCVAESTVRAHIHNILDKLHLDNRVQAATFVMRMKPVEAIASIVAQPVNGHL